MSTPPPARPPYTPIAACASLMLLPMSAARCRLPPIAPAADRHARRRWQVECLQNRVERLRDEERKAKQKVLETKLRGQEIQALQQRNTQTAAAKALAKRMEEEQRQMEMKELRMRRAREKEGIKDTYKRMFEERRKAVQAERDLKAENAQMVRSLQQHEKDRCKAQVRTISDHKKRVSERFEKQRSAHQEFLAQDFINMIAMEDRRREEVEKEIVDMEAEERKHIDQLRQLQQEQKDAYDALEQALANR